PGTHLMAGPGSDRLPFGGGVGEGVDRRLEEAAEVVACFGGLAQAQAEAPIEEPHQWRGGPGAHGAVGEGGRDAADDLDARAEGGRRLYLGEGEEVQATPRGLVDRLAQQHVVPEAVVPVAQTLAAVTVGGEAPQKVAAVL